MLTDARTKQPTNQPTNQQTNTMDTMDRNTFWQRQWKNLGNLYAFNFWDWHISTRHRIIYIVSLVCQLFEAILAVSVTDSNWSGQELLFILPLKVINRWKLTLHECADERGVW